MQAQKNQFIGCDKEYREADTVLFGAPYDSTTSFRPGTRFGPNAMRAESFGIETYSMLQDKDLVDDTKVFDAGDIELPFGAPAPALKMIERQARKILKDGKRPFLLGGEHLVTLPVVKAVLEKHPDLVRDENDLIYTLYISVADAINGCEAQIPSVDGKLKIKIEPGTQPGKMLRLRNKGIPDVNGYGTGDLLVFVQVWIPKKISKLEKEMVEKLGESENFKVDPSDDDRTLFDRIKNMFR